ncbi:MAG: hypothetical protein ACTHN5_14965 [Phycisphaerae bacterium]
MPPELREILPPVISAKRKKEAPAQRERALWWGVTRTVQIANYRRSNFAVSITLLAPLHAAPEEVPKDRNRILTRNQPLRPREANEIPHIPLDAKNAPLLWLSFCRCPAPPATR